MDVSSVLHPVVRDEVVSFAEQIYAKYAAGGPGSERLGKALSLRGLIWAKTRGNKLLAGVAGGLVAAYFVGAMAMSAQTTATSVPTGPAALVVSLVVLGPIGYIAYWLRRNRKTLSTAELRELLPVMDLGKFHTAYCQAVMDVADSRLLDDDQRSDMIERLNALIDFDLRLGEHRESLVGGSASKAPSTSVEQEYEDVRGRLEATTDTETRLTLEQSLALIEKRRKSRGDLATALARIDAQRDLILQTVLTVNEDVSRLTVVPRKAKASELDMEGLRRSVAQLGEQTEAVEKAVDEVLQLRL